MEAMGIEVDGVHRKDGILFLRHDGEWTRFYFLLMYPALYYYQEKGVREVRLHCLVLCTKTRCVVSCVSQSVLRK